MQMTNSRLSAARRCQRFHHIRYNLGYEPALKDEDLSFGTLWHKGQEVWHKTRDYEAALAAMDKGEPYALANAKAMLIGYHARWVDEPLEVLGIEVPFDTPMVNPATGRPSQNWTLAGKMDGIVKQDGRVLFMEHKTSSSEIGPGSDYWKRLKMDGQVSVYYEGARSLGHDVHGCLYDIARKPALRPLQVNSKRSTPETPLEFGIRCAEAIAAEPDKYFQRGVVVRLEAEMEEALQDVWQLSQQIRESELSGRHPRNPGSCSMYGKTCPYFGVCTGEQALDGPHFKLTPINEELKP